MLPSCIRSKTRMGILLSRQKVIAVWSMTRKVARHDLHEPDLLVTGGIGDNARIGAVDAVHPRVGAFQDRVRLDLGRPQGGRRVRGEVRVAHARREDHDAALFQVANGATADVGLAHLGHVDRRQHPGGTADALEGVLQGEGVYHRAEHAHDVRGGTVHALAGTGGAPPDVAPADDDGDLDVELVAGGADLIGEAAHSRGVDGLVRQRARERLAGELENHPVPRGARSSSRRCGSARSPTPRRRRSRADDGLSETEHLCLLPSSCAIVCCSSRTKGCSSRTRSLYQPCRRPSTILSSAAAGLPSFWAMRDRRSCGTPRPARQGRPRDAGTRDGRRRCEGRSRGRAPRRPRELDQHGVDAPTVLQVQVAADDGALGSLEADGAAEGDVLLQDDGEVLDPVGELGRAPASPFSASSLAISSTRETNSGDFATKSVSHSSIAIAPTGLWSPSTTTATAPWERSRFWRFAALMMPSSRSRRSASSWSPSASSRRAPASRMPAPVLREAPAPPLRLSLPSSSVLRSVLVNWGGAQLAHSESQLGRFLRPARTTARPKRHPGRLEATSGLGRSRHAS